MARSPSGNIGALPEEITTLQPVGNDPYAPIAYEVDFSPLFEVAGALIRTS